MLIAESRNNLDRLDSMLDAMVVYKEKSYHLTFVHEKLAMGQVDFESKTDSFSLNNTVSSSDNKNMYIVFDGDIYNTEYLQQTWFSSISTNHFRDEDVIIASYRKWGRDCVKYFEGVFSFIIYDSKEEIIFGARDHFGVKPLYYAKLNNEVMFASEIKSILTQIKNIKPNNSAIVEYLRTYNAEHWRETFFSGIEQLMPGEIFEYRNKEMYISRYYDLCDFVIINNRLKQNEADERFFHLLSTCTHDSIKAVEKAGVLFSGGIDSASLLASAINTSDNIKIKAYTAISDDSSCKEIEEFKRMFEFYGVSSKFISTSVTGIAELLEKSIKQLEMPFPLSSMAYTPLCKAAADNDYNVLLHGQAGGAVQSGGLAQYSAFLQDLLLNGDVYEFYKNLMGWGEGKKEKKIISFSKSVWQYHKPKSYMAYRASKNNYLQYFKKDFIKEVEFRPPLKYRPFNSVMQNITYESIYLGKQPRLLRLLDRYSQGNGCEIRMPYLDRRLVEFLFSVPDKYKIQKGQQKMLVRRSMNTLIPKYTFEKKKNTFMQDHFSQLDKNSMRKIFLGTLSDPRMHERGVFNSELISSIILDPNTNLRAIKDLALIELWFRQFID